MVVVIPTRNRADLVRNAIASVLSQARPDIRVLVSDNSTTGADRAELVRYCQELGSEQVRYVCPPQLLPMSQHWNWAVEQALSLGSATHFTILADRMVFKPEALAALISITAAHPDRLLCYMHDRVDDFAPPYKVQQYEWTGKLYEVSSNRLLWLSANSVMYDACVPRMLNCIVPRTVLDAIRSRFGSVFASNAPDWNFAYRVLDLLDSVLFFHKAMLVHYALRRSSGESAHRGVTNSTLQQFLKDLPAPLNVAAPYPEIITVWNAVVGEYLSAKQESQSGKLPALNMERYVHALAIGIASIEDPEIKRDMRQKLMARGGNPLHRFRQHLPILRELMTMRGFLSKVRSLPGSSQFKTFKTPEQAFQFAVTHFRPILKTVVWEEALHQGVEVLSGSAQASTTMVRT
jgi:glycosyltransferase involved in cell wall biosynthesis